MASQPSSRSAAPGSREPRVGGDALPDVEVPLSPGWAIALEPIAPGEKVSIFWQEKYRRAVVRNYRFAEQVSTAPPQPPISSAGRTRISDEELDARVRACIATGGWTWTGLMNALHDQGIAMSSARIRYSWKTQERRLRPH